MSTSGDAASPLDHALVIARPQAPRRGQPLTSSISPFFVCLDPRFQPRQVVLIYDREDVRYVQTIEQLLKSRAVEVTHWQIDTMVIPKASHELDRLLDGWGETLPLCVTSANPTLMALALSVFTGRRYPVLHVVQNVLYRLGSKSQHIRLEPRFEVDELLSHLGARISGGWAGVWFEEHLRDLSHFLIESAHGCVASLEVIQRLARQTSDERLLSPPIKGTEIAIPLFSEVLDRFESAGCLELNQGRLKFGSKQHRAYCSGGWLSLYVQATLAQLRERITLHCTRQDITLELAYPTPLEVTIPLTVTFNGQLCFFFCVSAEHSELAHIFEASERLQDYFGASVCILSIDELHSEDQERARLMGVSLCEGEMLKRLDEWVIDALII